MYKDNANERNESLLSNSRVQLILYKDNARRVQRQGGLSYTKIMQGECNGKEGKRSFTALDTAEPKLILYKDNHKMEYSKVLTQFFPLFPIYLPELPLRHFNMVVQRRQQHG